MQYIVLDMEWNQAWPGSYAAKKAMEIPIHGEIIQIGAVRIHNGKVLDEFQTLISPKVMKKLNKKISSLTGIREEQLKDKGVPFPEAIKRFRDWCGKNCTYLTWGCDDLRILKENLLLHDLDYAWTEPWYNAQLIFNAQTDGASSQKSLKTAMEMMNINPTRPAHDALGDAFHTALICAKLDLDKGVSEYAKSLKKREEGFKKEIPDCLDRKVFSGYSDKEAALDAMAGEENICPKCGEKMKARKWVSQPGHRYMVRVSCRKCGGFLVRVRLQTDEDGTFCVSRLTYSGSSDAAKTYDRQVGRKFLFFRRRKKKQET